eukprot:4884440-Alexandrium_andersonii.AAC.1
MPPCWRRCYRRLQAFELAARSKLLRTMVAWARGPNLHTAKGAPLKLSPGSARQTRTQADMRQSTCTGGNNYVHKDGNVADRNRSADTNGDGSAKSDHGH